MTGKTPNKIPVPASATLAMRLRRKPGNTVAAGKNRNRRPAIQGQRFRDIETRSSTPTRQKSLVLSTRSRPGNLVFGHAAHIMAFRCLP